MDSSLGIEIAEQQPQHQHHHHHHIHQQIQTQQQQTQQQHPSPLHQNHHHPAAPQNHQNHNQVHPQPNHQNHPQQAQHQVTQLPQSQPSFTKNQTRKLQLHRLQQEEPHKTQDKQSDALADGNNEQRSTNIQASTSTFLAKSTTTTEYLETFFDKGLYNSCEATEELIKSIEESHDEALANRLLQLYQHHYSTLDRPWEHVTFMYGLGLIYMHFNAYNWATKSFRDALYVQPSFTRSRDIHTRLGLIFKATGRYKLSEKHFNLAINDTRQNSGTSTKYELRFQLAHLYEIQCKHKQAIELYEKLLQENDLPQKLSANIYRQLGWIHYNTTNSDHKSNLKNNDDLDSLNNDTRSDSRQIEAALQYLNTSNKTETNSETSYYLGRCLTNIGKFQDAFASYRSVIDKEESTADTWCSIGVLYQRQNQPWDALQAYIRSVQYDKKHAIAWMNLGILYESHNQFKDALKCYLHVIRSTNNGVDKSLQARINYIQRHIKEIEASTMSSNNGTKKVSDSDILLSLEDLWNLESKNNRDNNPSITSNKLDNSSTRLSKESSNNKMTNQHHAKNPNNNINIDNDNSVRWRDDRVTPMEIDGPQHRLTDCPYFDEIDRRSLDTRSEISDKDCRDAVIINKIETTSSNSDSKTFSSSSKPLSLHTIHPKQEAYVIKQNGLPSTQKETTRKDHLSNYIDDFEHKNQQSHLLDSKEFCFSQTITNGASKDSGISSDSSTYADCALVPSQSTDFSTASCTSAEQIVESCKNISHRPSKLDINLSSDDHRPPLVFPRSPPYPPLPSDKLFPSPPSIFLESKKELTLKRLQDLCQSHPISIVRNIATVLKLDLGLFSTKTLVESNPEQQIDIVSHLSHPFAQHDAEGTIGTTSEEDINNAWTCERHRSKSTISRYAAYQVVSFRESLQVEKDNKLKPNLTKESETDSNESLAIIVGKKNGTIATGTSPITNDQRSSGPCLKKMKIRETQKQMNFVKSADFIDLSDEKRWRPQLNELNKLPHFVKCVSASNMLTHIGSAVPGINTISMSMHVPGCRIIGNRAPNNFCPITINTGPGDYEWCAISGDYERILSKLCNRQGLDIDSRDWWPKLSDLQKYNVPIYRFSQRPGDLVWVNSGTFYWIHSTGWTNCIQWNIGPLCAKQYRMSSDSFEVNKLVSRKSEVPMIQMTWNMVININIITDDDLFHSMTDVLRRSLQYCVMVHEFVKQTNEGKKIKIVDNEHGPRPAKYCTLCEVEIFNISFKRKHRDDLHCVECARRADSTLDEYKVYQEYDLKYLMEIYDNFIKFKQRFQARQMHFKRQQLMQQPV